MNVDDKLQQAKELIKEKRYQEAKDILFGMNHPTAKQWLEKIDSILDKENHKLQQAKELIKEKRYQEAKDILVGINHPIAKQWLEKINLILDDPFLYDDPFTTQNQQPQQQALTYSPQNVPESEKMIMKIFMMIGAFIVFILVFLIALNLLRPVQGNVFSNIFSGLG